MPDLSEPKLPVFSQGTLNEEEIAKQFGKIRIHSSEDIKMSFSVEKVNEVAIHDFNIFHLSLLPPDKFWACDNRGNLIKCEMEERILRKISTNTGANLCYHTVTREGELLFTDILKRAIYKVNVDMNANKLMSTGDWVPVAIHSSIINGHILVVMWKNTYMKVTRYNREGKTLQYIQRDVTGKDLYLGVAYITENFNGDICTSDYVANKVVVVTKLGRYRFSYSGKQSQDRFCPNGICTDVMGHILVSDGYVDSHSSSVHLLDMDGHFLSFLLTQDQCPPYPCALCIDYHNNLWIRSLNSSTVAVFKYM
ncbi:uncharacterized protein LOC133180627 [Saccostrea echinata]|uniref:uncharacterized protein LOC133180627 n=1 Tax=Saccostrea echinata TaxID=191078 RepID=UPI002A7F1485|nr:uncharacterized protein LOC133180627 [Saccostrea echinata]